MAYLGGPCPARLAEVCEEKPAPVAVTKLHPLYIVASALLLEYSVGVEARRAGERNDRHREVQAPAIETATETIQYDDSRRTRSHVQESRYRYEMVQQRHFTEKMPTRAFRDFALVVEVVDGHTDRHDRDNQLRRGGSRKGRLGRPRHVTRCSETDNRESQRKHHCRTLSGRERNDPELDHEADQERQPDAKQQQPHHRILVGCTDQEPVDIERVRIEVVHFITTLI